MAAENTEGKDLLEVGPEVGQKDEKETGGNEFPGSSPEPGKKMDDEIKRLLGQGGDLPENPDAKKQKRRISRRRVIIGAVVLLAVVIGFLAFGNSGGDAVRVAVVNPARKDIKSTLTISGPVSGTDSVDIVSNVHAEILQIAVSEGERVKQGQLIAVLDDTALRRELAIAKNAYDLAVSTCEEMDKEAELGYAKALQDEKAAQDNYNRMKVLFEGGSVPQVDLEAAQAAVDDAVRNRQSYTVIDGKAVAPESYRIKVETEQLQYEKALRQIDDTQILAPIDGTLVRVNTRVGRFADKAEDDTPLFEIMNLDTLEMKVQISEYSIGNVSVGQEVEISADILGGEKLRGEVVSISPTGEEKDGSSTERVVPTTIRIMDTDTKLIAGITARATIILDTAENVLTVPVASMLQIGEKIYIQTVRDGVIHQIPVTAGVENDVDVEVIPEEGETIDEQTQVLAAPSVDYTEGMAAVAAGQ